MIDRLKQMAIFAKTIDHGSFRGAASELRLSPSVVSHHISQLEENLGVALLYRSTRKLALTREGARLLAATRSMLDAVEGELLALSATASHPSGEIRMTVPSVLSQSSLTEKIAAFAATHPRIRLSLDFSDKRRALIEDGFDIAIRMGTKPKTSATTRRLFAVDRIVVASKAYLATQAPAQSPQDLLAMDWLTLTPVQNVPLAFRHVSGPASKIKPASQVSTNDARALYRLAKAGAGLAIVPAFLAEQDIAEGEMAHVLPDWRLPPIHVFAVWPANAPRHGLIHLALDALN